MQVNWIIIAIVVLIAIVIIFFTVRKNLKEKKKLEDFLQHKPTESKEDQEEY